MVEEEPGPHGSPGPSDGSPSPVPTGTQLPLLPQGVFPSTGFPVDMQKMWMSLMMQMQSGGGFPVAAAALAQLQQAQQQPGLPPGLAPGAPLVPRPPSSDTALSPGSSGCSVTADQVSLSSVHYWPRLQSRRVYSLSSSPFSIHFILSLGARFLIAFPLWITLLISLSLFSLDRPILPPISFLSTPLSSLP